MTDPHVHVVVPYARFLASQDRRNRVAAELMRRDQSSAIDALLPEPDLDGDMPGAASEFSTPWADHVRPLI